MNNTKYLNTNEETNMKPVDKELIYREFYENYTDKEFYNKNRVAIMSVLFQQRMSEIDMPEEEKEKIVGNALLDIYISENEEKLDADKVLIYKQRRIKELNEMKYDWAKNVVRRWE